MYWKDSCPIAANEDSLCLEYNHIGKYSLFYANEANFKEMYNEVFAEKVCDFESNKKAPLIIDCGSNIGMTTVFFKDKFSLAKIICFEPDPNVYIILEKNINVNKLKDITLINAALSDLDGETDFFGEFYGDHPNSLGNSIIETWGNRGYTDRIKVKAAKLSNFINREVDFLKLDIEGAELQVLEELGDKLKLIRKMLLEIHSSQQEIEMGKVEKIKALLKKYNFQFDIIEKDIKCLLPPKQKPWIKKINPQLHIISAKNMS